ncbi:MAG: NB-ARC domain-containing protein [Cyanobacteria bacterium J06598_3]
MARPTYGPQAQKRARRLLETLLAFANDEFEDCDLLYSKVKINWQTNTQLVVRTQIRYLEMLTGKDPHPGKLSTDQIKESLKRYEDYLEILEDNRASTQGASDWHFTLTLWHRRYDSLSNLQRFEKEWQTRRPLKSKQATAAVEPSASTPSERSPSPIQVKGETQPLSQGKSTRWRGPSVGKSHPTHDWGQAIDVATFYGRTTELATLTQWIKTDRCRLIALLGMGGVGKTALSVKLAEQCQTDFDYLIWRSLRNAPPILELLADLIQVLSGQNATDLPTSLDGRLRQLMHYLQSHRCLLVLDNLESILSGSTVEQPRSGTYRQGYEGYGQLLRDLGESPHQSCLIITSREKPRGVSRWEDKTGGVRSLLLRGLKQSESEAVLHTKGITLSGEQIQILVQQYSGNPLALQIVATTVQELFDGDISQFLAQGSSVFGDISDLLRQQLQRLSVLEQRVMHWLAIYRDWTALADLKEDLLPAAGQRAILEALESLQRRSLIEKREGEFTQQPVVMEYVTTQLIEGFSQALLNKQENGSIDWLNQYALTQAQTYDYIRQAQTQLLLRPVVETLLAQWGHPKRVEQALKNCLSQLKSPNSLFSEPGYAAGNFLKLLHHINADLAGLDCSGLSIWQVYLQEMSLCEVNFANADFRKTVFAQISKRFMSAMFSPDGAQLATGVDQDIMLWEVSRCSPEMTYVGHQGWVHTLAFSPDGKVLASGSSDRTLRLWTVETGQCQKTLRGHEGAVHAVAFSPDGKQLVSGGAEGQLRLWEPSTGKLLKTIAAHKGQIYSVAFTPNGERLLSSGQDGTVRLWNLATETCEKTIETSVHWSLACGLSHDGKRVVTGSDGEAVYLWTLEKPQEPQRLAYEDNVWAAAFSPDDRMVVTASDDRTLRLWDSQTGQCLKTLQAHQNRVWLATFSPDGAKLASCSDDQTLKLWNVATGDCISTLKTYSDAVMAVAVSPDGERLVSGSEDGYVRLWNKATGKVTQTLTAHTNVVGAITFDQTGKRFASGSDDETVRLWDSQTGECLRTFWGHEGWVHEVAFDPLGRYLASSGHDQTVRLWDMRSGECVKTLVGHGHRVKAIAFSPDGKLLASGSDDRTIRLWDAATGECVQVVEAHEGWVVALEFGVTEVGYVLASGSADATVKVWEILAGEEVGEKIEVSCVQTMVGHEGGVRSLSFGPGGDWLASGSTDHVVKQWQVSTGECVQTMAWHDEVVWAVACCSLVGESADGAAGIVSGSGDGTMRLWEVASGDCVRVMRSQRPYEEMNITGATGLSDAQRKTLLALGAIQA